MMTQQYTTTDYFSELTKHRSINLATHNIRGAFNNKLLDILNHMIEHNIHIFHACETHIINQTLTTNNSHSIIKHFHIPTKKYFYIIQNPDQSNRSSGNAIILSSLLYKHVQKIQSIPGRLIKLILFFKQKIQIHIIAIYLPPTLNDQTKNIFSDILTFFKTHI